MGPSASSRGFPSPISKSSRTDAKHSRPNGASSLLQNCVAHMTLLRIAPFHCCEGSRRFVACLLDDQPHSLQVGAETTSMADGVHALLSSSPLRTVNWFIPKEYDRVV